jgi:hypothetical protein
VRHHGKLAILSGIQQAGAIIVLVPLNSGLAWSVITSQI